MQPRACVIGVHCPYPEHWEPAGISEALRASLPTFPRSARVLVAGTPQEPVVAVGGHIGAPTVIAWFAIPMDTQIGARARAGRGGQWAGNDRALAELALLFSKPLSGQAECANQVHPNQDDERGSAVGQESSAHLGNPPRSDFGQVKTQLGDAELGKSMRGARLQCSVPALTCLSHVEQRLPWRSQTAPVDAPRRTAPGCPLSDRPASPLGR
jgi:hypothetical protein